MKQYDLTLKRKLRNYSILSGAVLMAASAAKGQILYHDINPDTTLTKEGDRYAFDLNGDHAIDFTFGKSVTSLATAIIFSFNNHLASFDGALSTFGSTKVGYPYVIDKGAKIGSSGNWLGYSRLKYGTKNAVHSAILGGIYQGTYYFGNWAKGESSKFIALRLKSGSKFNYGWVRCSVAASGQSGTVMDYAIQTIPDSSINAGDTGTSATGISARQLHNVSVYSSGKIVTVKYPDAHEGMTIVITDMPGKEVRVVQTTNELYQMNLADQATGVYTVTVRSKGTGITKKVLIQ